MSWMVVEDTMGTGRPVAATGARCPRCDAAELVDRVDLIGRVRLACTACRWSEQVRAHAPPAEPEPPVTPNIFVHLTVEAQNTPDTGEQRYLRSLQRAQEIAALFAREWEPLQVVATRCGRNIKTLDGQVQKAMRAGLIERKLEEKRGWRRLVYRRAA